MRYRTLLLVVALASVAACKRHADPADEHQHHHEQNLPPTGASVKVTLDGTPADVVLSSIPADGAPGSVSFLRLWKAAWPSQDPSQLRFDFVGSDGFRPTSRSKCTRLLTGGELASARLEIATHDLVLDEASKLPGCYKVRAVVAIEATR
jgi:hypothetical protein